MAASAARWRTPTRPLLQPERLDPVRVLLGVAAVHAVRQRLDHAQQRVCERTYAGLFEE